MDKLFEEYTHEVILWAISNKYKIIFLVLVSFFIHFASLLPYVNLVLTKKLVIFLVSVSFFVIFKIDWRKILYIIFLLFFIVFIFTLLKEGEKASIIGDYIYGFLVLTSISYFQDI
ncbi:hypothetical protein CO054_00035 [Candidatus Shapirobacteria bacterium CG_4_9_14_0_2_um_filter_39_11]|uniref:Uncharacterized protein n=1 Tax=Candidatus Shapirobacteria bacterium CG_4_9_14_0_2_um_filter_39_11 TaxID=1974478 RepID=A0A2M8ETK8_9BACT|nr:MAG: hypothetical protein CO054_00035 [Candidatus Shapirobacteria bacterium CG_4_9_14_0_2_um_filter_39_11]